MACLVIPLTITPRAPLLWDKCRLLAGDHVSAANNAERARTIADKNQRHSDVRLTPPIGALNVISEDLSDPIPRLEWMGVQRFTAGDHSSAGEFFARARKLVLHRLKDQECLSRRGRSLADDDEVFDSWGRAEDGGRCALLAAAHPVRSKVRHATDRSVALSSKANGSTNGDAATGEFHPEAMRLDRCMAVAICRQGPAAF